MEIFIKHTKRCCSLVTKLWSTLLWPHGLLPTRLLCPWISQARILEWVVIPSLRGSSRPRIEPTSLALASVFFITEPHGEPAYHSLLPVYPSDSTPHTPWGRGLLINIYIPSICGDAWHRGCTGCAFAGWCGCCGSFMGQLRLKPSWCLMKHWADWEKRDSPPGRRTSKVKGTEALLNLLLEQLPTLKKY